jgi:ATP-binding cassette subfamily B protein
MSIHTHIPEAVQPQLSGEPLFSAKSDLQQDGHFGELWVVITETEISVWHKDGSSALKLDLTQV